MINLYSRMICSDCGYQEVTESTTWVCPKCSLNQGLFKLRELGNQAREKIVEISKQPDEQPVAAVKYDSGKPDMTLVTYAMLEDAVKVLMFGEKKYARFNYRNPSPGFEQRMLAAVMRHVTQHNGGEEIDKESGLPHLAHALATLMMVFDRRAHTKE